jgi:hypothetical protein
VSGIDLHNKKLYKTFKVMPAREVKKNQNKKKTLKFMSFRAQTIPVKTHRKYQLGQSVNLKGEKRSATTKNKTKQQY